MSNLRKRFLPAGQIPLNALKPGEAAYVSHIALTDTMRRRLQDMGLIPGVAVECVAVSPLGDPAAYRLKGAVIALRRADAGFVTVKVEPLQPEASLAAALAGCEGLRPGREG